MACQGLLNPVRRLALVLLLAAALVPECVFSAPATVEQSDKCPVCGMFVAKYPDFLAQIVWEDGTSVFFDGAKDMFKYFFNLKKYAPSREQSEIASVYVTDYYGMTLIDGRRAWYIIGSDVFGPMGRELIPFVEEEDAAEFFKDHAGKKRLRFQDVTPDIIDGLQ